MIDALEQVVPEGWAVAKLADVTLKVPNIKPEEEPARLFKYVDISGIDNDVFEIVGTKEFSGMDAPSRAKRPICSGDVLFSNDRTYLKNIAVVPDELDGQVASTGFTVLRPNGAVLTKYLYRWVLTDQFVDTVTPQQTGSSYPATTDRVVRDQSLPLPPLAGQERIVAKVEPLLSQVQSVRQRLAAVPDILKHFRLAILDHACSGRLTDDWRAPNDIRAEVREDELPGGWKLCALRDLCTGFQYGSSRKSEQEGDVPVLRMGNIQASDIDWRDLKYSSDPEEIAKYSLEPNTVLFNRTNSPELVGKTAIYRGDRPAIFAGYLIRILHGPQLDPEYLNYCLNEQNFREYCMRVKSDGVSQSNINAKKLAAYAIPFPAVDEQREIVRRVKALFALANSVEERVQAAIRRAEMLIQSILAKAFRGELVPTEADVARAEVREYETGEQLLARIREEAALSQPEKKARRKTTKRKKVLMKKLDRESVQDAIRSMPHDLFSFDELSDELPSNYDALKNILFAMLEDADSGLEQVFDEQAQAMRFSRRSTA